MRLCTSSAAASLRNSLQPQRGRATSGCGPRRDWLAGGRHIKWPGSGQGFIAIGPWSTTEDCGRAEGRGSDLVADGRQAGKSKRERTNSATKVWFSTTSSALGGARHVRRPVSPRLRRSCKGKCATEHIILRAAWNHSKVISLVVRVTDAAEAFRLAIIPHPAPREVPCTMMWASSRPRLVPAAQPPPRRTWRWRTWRWAGAVVRNARPRARAESSWSHGPRRRRPTSSLPTPMLVSFRPFSCCCRPRWARR